jgi:hypothetical protein
MLDGTRREHESVQAELQARAPDVDHTLNSAPEDTRIAAQRTRTFEQPSNSSAEDKRRRHEFSIPQATRSTGRTKSHRQRNGRSVRPSD